MRHLLAIFLVCALVAPAAAQSLPVPGYDSTPVDRQTQRVEQQQAFPSVVRVTAGAHVGSGVAVYSQSRRTLILTCQHVVGGGIPTALKSGTQYPSLRDREGYRSRTDRHGHDLASFWIMGEIPTSPLAPITSPAAFVVGYGGSEHPQGLRAHPLSVGPEWSGKVRSGDSGGPIFDRQMRVLSIVRGRRQTNPDEWKQDVSYQNTGDVIASPQSAVISYVQRVLEREGISGSPVDRTQWDP